MDPQIGTANKRAMFLNLLYRVLQRDQSELRLYAFIKRILQITVYFPANMACATLYVASKILQGRKHLRHALLEPHAAVKIEKQEVEEVCEVNDEITDTEDIHVIDEIKCEVEHEEDNTIMLSNLTTGANTVSETKPDIKVETLETTKPYDPFCRNPLYAGMTKGFNMELAALARHFHPSVALFANAIIQGTTSSPIFFPNYIPTYTSFIFLTLNLYFITLHTLASNLYF